MRILIADDSLLLREGLALVLTEEGHDVVSQVSEGPSFVSAMLEHRPDLGLVDVRMPPTHTDDGLRAAVELRKQWQAAPIVVLSQYIVPGYAKELLEDGMEGIGYLLKDRVSDIDGFLSTLEHVAAGGTILDPEVVKQLMLTARQQPLDQLTARERETLELMAEGHSNMSIAERMTVSTGAVEKNVQRIFAKLGLYPDDSDSHRRVRAVLTYLQSSTG